MDAKAGPGLQHLLKAKSKAAVNEFFTDTFDQRFVPFDSQAQKCAETFGVSEEEARQLIKDARILIRGGLYLYQPGAAGNYDSLFPNSFHKDLKGLLVALLNGRIPTWREAAVKDQVHLPRLMDIDWRIDIKSASESISRMSVPTVIFGLKVEDPPRKVTDKAGVKTLNLEMNMETLQTMIDGLKFVEGQLSSIK